MNLPSPSCAVHTEKITLSQQNILLISRQQTRIVGVTISVVTVTTVIVVVTINIVATIEIVTTTILDCWGYINKTFCWANSLFLRASAKYSEFAWSLLSLPQTHFFRSFRSAICNPERSHWMRIAPDYKGWTWASEKLDFGGERGEIVQTQNSTWPERM